MTPAEINNREHMERVRAVHQRSAYERALERIRYIEQAREAAELGLRQPLRDYMIEELEHLRVLRDTILAEMITAGQVLDLP